MREADFNRFMQLKIQLFIAAENFVREENLFPVVVPTLSKDMDEQLELAHKVLDVVDRANKKIFVTLQRYNVDRTKSCPAQVRLFAQKVENEKFQQIFYVNFNYEEFIDLIDDKLK